MTGNAHWRRTRPPRVDEATSWLAGVAVSGPFLTAPVLKRVSPMGPPPVRTQVRAGLRSAVTAMMNSHGAGRDAVIAAMLGGVLHWGERWHTDLPDALAVTVPEAGQVIRPDFAFWVDPGEAEPPLSQNDSEPDLGEIVDREVVDGDFAGSGVADRDGRDADEAGAAADVDAAAGPYRLFGILVPWDTHPMTRVTRDGWTASPAERLAVLLRARDVPVGLVTDGRWWALVWAPTKAAVGVAVWDAERFAAEPDTLAAFAMLLDRRRFLGVAASDTLPKLLDESASAQEELTDALGRQVRNALELWVTTVDRADADSGDKLLTGVDDDELYAGAVTVMMRIVFLLFAEERRLLPSDDEVYRTAYSVSGLVDDLRRRAAVAGRSSLAHRTSAWHRLLAVSRAVHGGVHHEDLRMPAYGGSLFDPEVHPWLEGRRAGGIDSAAFVLPVDDGTVLSMLEAVQFVTVGGTVQQVTFRALGVEQIGYVYEGLLELEVHTATELMLHLVRPSDWPRTENPCEVPATQVQEWSARVPPAVVKEAAKRIGISTSTVERRLAQLIDEHVVQQALGSEFLALIDALQAVYPLLARDELGRARITMPGRRYLGRSTRRNATGAHYTPPKLAADIVSGALDPLVFRPGPLQTADASTWRLRNSDDIKALRVADIAMGSGAFLVAACRYLADKLVQAWQLDGDAAALNHQFGQVGDTEVPPILLKARRVVAEKCLYGVDINPLAVEMAKLSLWLFTMDGKRPFGFLDDRLVAGDSLLGLAEFDQLATLHLDPKAGRAARDTGAAMAFDLAQGWRELLDQAAEERRRITALPALDARDIEIKQSRLANSRQLVEPVRIVADFLTSEGLRVAKFSDKKLNTALLAVELAVDAAGEHPETLVDRIDLQAGRPAGRADRTPLHWPIAFPEVFLREHDAGFDAIIGNPPFWGGQKLSGGLGDDYLDWLQAWDGRRFKGSADLAARFVLRAQRLLNSRGQLGFIATNTLVEGATLRVGLEQAVGRGLSIRSGTTSRPWPTNGANLEIVDLWASKAAVATGGQRELDGEPVPAIGADLQPVGRVTGPKYRLAENEGIAFQGSNILGTGFTMTHEQAAELIELDPRNAEALQPYVIGKDLNQRFDQSASRWVINFRNWSLDRAEDYPELIRIVRRDVKPLRDGSNRPARRERWWRYAEAAPELYEAIAPLDHVLTLSLHGSFAMPVRLPTGPVFSHGCGVFAFGNHADLAVLSSNVHQIWVIRYTGTLETRVRYAPSDVFLTLPRPLWTGNLENLGRRLDEERRALMLERKWGLTTTYNAVHNPAVMTDPEITALRELHRDIDFAVLRAYGWEDLDPEIGHHKTKLGDRWTFSPAARFELLDRLLQENHDRYAAQTNP